jgi:hypothetical protein
MDEHRCDCQAHCGGKKDLGLRSGVVEHVEEVTNSKYGDQNPGCGFGLKIVDPRQ